MQNLQDKTSETQPRLRAVRKELLFGRTNQEQPPFKDSLATKESSAGTKDISRKSGTESHLPETTDLQPSTSVSAQLLNTIEESAIHELMLDTSNCEHLVVSNTRYNRNGYAELTALQETIGDMYSCGNVIITASGMAAIYLALMSISIENKWQKVNLVYGNELYCDTPRLFSHFQKTFDNLSLQSADIGRLESDKEDLFANKHNVLFVESCTNPNGKMFDFSVVPNLRKVSKSLIVVVDNTWLTSCVLNPFEAGADIVVTSLTKYYSGGNVIAGAILFKNKKLHDSAFTHNKNAGNHINPLTVKIVSDNINSTETRVRMASDNTINVLNRLQTHKKIVKINHRYLENIVLPMYPSVFTIVVHQTKAKVLSILRQSKLKHETSFGSPYSKSDPWPTEKNGETTFRISIGWNDDMDTVYQDLVDIIDRV
jgi:cystathionine beta-lyase/cystathionine gamma-synthase